MENGIRALQVVIPTISILLVVLLSVVAFIFWLNRAHIRSPENDLPQCDNIATKLTAIFAPIRRVCSYHSIETSKASVYHSTISKTNLREREEGDTHEEIEVVSEHKNSVFKALFSHF